MSKRSVQQDGIVTPVKINLGENIRGNLVTVIHWIGESPRVNDIHHGPNPGRLTTTLERPNIVAATFVDFTAGISPHPRRSKYALSFGLARIWGSTMFPWNTQKYTWPGFAQILEKYKVEGLISDFEEVLEKCHIEDEGDVIAGGRWILYFNPSVVEGRVEGFCEASFKVAFRLFERCGVKRPLWNHIHLCQHVKSEILVDGRWHSYEDYLAKKYFVSKV